MFPYCTMYCNLQDITPPPQKSGFGPFLLGGGGYNKKSRPPKLDRIVRGVIIKKILEALGYYLTLFFLKNN